MAGRQFVSWLQASLLFVEKLDVVRRMVSSACSAPLPLDREACLLPPIVEENDPLNLGVKTSALPVEILILLLPLHACLSLISSFIHAFISTELPIDAYLAMKLGKRRLHADERRFLVIIFIRDEAAGGGVRIHRVHLQHSQV